MASPVGMDLGFTHVMRQNPCKSTVIAWMRHTFSRHMDTAVRCDHGARVLHDARDILFGHGVKHTHAAAVFLDFQCQFRRRIHVDRLSPFTQNFGKVLAV